MGRRGSLGPCCFCFQERMSPGLWKDRGEKIRCVEQQPEGDRKSVCFGGRAGVSATPQNQTQSCRHSLLPDLPLLMVASQAGGGSSSVPKGPKAANQSQGQPTGPDLTGTYPDTSSESKLKDFRDFPVGLVVKTSNAGGAGLIPAWGTKSLQAARCGQKKKKGNDLPKTLLWTG